MMPQQMREKEKEKEQCTREVAAANTRRPVRARKETGVPAVPICLN